MVSFFCATIPFQMSNTNLVKPACTVKPEHCRPLQDLVQIVAKLSLGAIESTGKPTASVDNKTSLG